MFEEFKKYETMQKLIEELKKYETMQKNISYIDSINKNIELANMVNNLSKVSIPAIVEEFDTVTKVAKNIDNLKQSQFSLEVEKITNSFLLTSSISEIYHSSIVKIPKCFSSLTLINNSLIETTDSLASEFDRLNSIYYENPIVEKLYTDLVAPSISVSVHFQILKSLHYIDTELDVSYEEEYFETLDERCSVAEIKIKNKNPDWFVLLDGAKQSFESKNPDKVRHTITSLRELITQILHECAPDEDIKKLYNDPNCYENGKPTRRVRIKYILSKKYSNVTLATFIDKDITAILELFNLYQEGTHKVISSLKDEELLLILKRTELLIEQLL